MNKEKMLEVAKILFLNEVPKEQAKYIGNFIEEQNAEIDKLNNIIDKQDRDITTLTKDKIKLKNIINELEKWIDEYYKSNRKWYNTELSNHDKIYFEREYINTEAMLVKFDKQLKELKEGNK